MGKCNSSSNRYAGWAERPEKPAVIIKWLKSIVKGSIKAPQLSSTLTRGSVIVVVAPIRCSCWLRKQVQRCTACILKAEETLNYQSAWGKEHYCKTVGKQVVLIPVYRRNLRQLSPCRNCTGSSEEWNPTSGGYQFSNKHNAYALSGRTVRWKAKTIQFLALRGLANCGQSLASDIALKLICKEKAGEGRGYKLSAMPTSEKIFVARQCVVVG
jgi:hypothetical protein